MTKLVRPRWALALLMATLLDSLTLAQPGAVAGRPASSELRAALEGTWQLEEWHVNGQVLKPPDADGRWSNRDGVVLFLLHRNGADTAESTMGYGIYQMDADTWGYRYLRMETSTGPPGGPAKVTVSRPSPDMRSFKVSRVGSKVVLEGAGGDRREYEGPFFTLFQKGQIVRRWRRVQQ
jgi:hypothetical protein